MDEVLNQMKNTVTAESQKEVLTIANNFLEQSNLSFQSFMANKLNNGSNTYRNIRRQDQIMRMMYYSYPIQQSRTRVTISSDR